MSSTTVPISPSTEAIAAAPDAASPGARHPTSRPVVELDVRDDLRSGREPFSRIMATVAALSSDEVLHLRAIFEPAPLFTVLGKRGFAHESEAHAADDWSVWFWHPTIPSSAPASAQATPGDTDGVPADALTISRCHSCRPRPGRMASGG